MRFYDPEEDLPPKDTPVYALFTAGTLYLNTYEDVLTWSPKSGWFSPHFDIQEVHLWCDWCPPNLTAEWKKRGEETTSTSLHNGQDATEPG